MFEFIITSSEVGTRKKDSAKIYEEALLKLGTTKEDTVVETTEETGDDNGQHDSVDIE